MATGKDMDGDTVMPQKGAVRRTILEIVEAPRLTGIRMADFVAFRDKRQIYLGQVKEKAAELNIPISPLTTFRISIDIKLIDLFIEFAWVPEKETSAVSEERLWNSDLKHSEILEDDYDFAFIHRAIECVKMDGKFDNIYERVTLLSLAYTTKLEKAGFPQFKRAFSYLAVGHILDMIDHAGLKRRTLDFYTMRKETHKKD